MNTKMIEKMIKWLIYTTFFIPLVAAPETFSFPFIVPKVLLFRSLTTIIFFLYAWLLFTNWKEYKFNGTPLNYALGAFLFSFTLSTIFGVDFHRSFWDSQLRMLGLLTMFHYLIFFYICSQIFRSWEDWEKALKVFFIAGLLVMLMGVIDPFHYVLQHNPRAVGTLGNAVYLGGYCLFLFFISLLLFLKSDKFLYRSFYSSGAILSLYVIFLSGSRGAMLGVLAGFFLIVLGYIFILASRRIKLGLASGLVIGSIIITSIYTMRDVENITGETSALDRIFNISLRDFNTSRIMAWEAAVKGWKEKPLLGWGPNNFLYIFNANYNPSALKFGYEETRFDNAHNVLLNTLSVQGLIGAVTYLAIFGSAFYMLITGYRKKSIDFKILIVFVALLTAHLLLNMTIFENPTSYLALIFCLAMINRLTDKSIKMASQPIPLSGKGFLFVTLLSVVIIVIFDVKPAMANVKAHDVLKEFAQMPTSNTIYHLAEAINLTTPHIDDIRLTYAQTIAKAICCSDKVLNNEKKKQLWNIAEKGAKRNIELHPMDIRPYMVMAKLYSIKAYLTHDPKAFNESKSYLNKALKLSPQRQEILFDLADIEMQLGNHKHAFSIYENAIDADPSAGEGYLVLAKAYLFAREYEKATAVIEKIKKEKIDLINDQIPRFKSIEKDLKKLSANR